jgi:membrane associated rhomboid family serine protease
MGNYMFMIPYALFLEHKLGRLKFTLFYFACGILAAASQVLGDAPGGMIGSSGAAFGVFAGACAMFDRTFVERCLAFLLLGLAVMQQFEMATSDFGASVAYWAHFGGALGGLALVHFFVKPYLQSQSTSVEPRK